jgi:hypothetical protein
VFVCSRIAPVLGRPAKDGKKFGGNFRNYSHCYEQGWASPAFGDGGPAGIGYINASKGEKPAIRAFLARQHEATWFAAIADSGQKHVLPWAPLNASGRAGRVLFDEQIVSVPDDQSLVADLATLLTSGATKDEIARGDYSARAWHLCGEQIRTFERAHSSERHSAWFGLACWLAQRDEEAVQRRIDAEKEERDRRKNKGRSAHKDSGGSAGRARRVSREPKRERAQALGPDPEPAARSSTNDIDAGGMGDPAVPESGTRGTEQLSLFGSRGSGA